MIKRTNKTYWLFAVVPRVSVYTPRQRGIRGSGVCLCVHARVKVTLLHSRVSQCEIGKIDLSSIDLSCPSSMSQPQEGFTETRVWACTFSIVLCHYTFAIIPRNRNSTARPQRIPAPAPNHCRLVKLSTIPYETKVETVPEPEGV